MKQLTYCTECGAFGAYHAKEVLPFLKMFNGYDTVKFFFDFLDD